MESNIEFCHLKATRWGRWGRMIISLAVPLGTATSALKFLNDMQQFCKHLQKFFLDFT